MSRTTRRRLPGYSPGDTHYEIQRDYDPNFIRRDWYHGRDDYGFKLHLHEPRRKSPKCYDVHGWEQWGLNKRFAKRMTGRYRRLNGHDEIRRQLGDMGEGSDLHR